MHLIFFVPGIMGSRLVERHTGREAWSFDLHTLTRTLYERPQTLRGDLVATEVITEADLSLYGIGFRHQPIYGPALDFLAGLTNCRVIPFPYDWRQSTEKAGELLSDKVKQVAGLKDKITLVGHSMGGLVARLAADRLRASALAATVERLVALGSPFKGSAKSFRTLRTGEPDLHWILKLWFNTLRIQKLATKDLSPARLFQALNRIQSVYDLLPNKDQYFLGYAGERINAFDDRVPWPQMANIYLQSARDLHKTIDESSRDLIHTIYAFQSRTHEGYNLGPDFQIDKINWQSDGDGTVRQESAQGDVPSGRRIPLEGSPSHEKLPLNKEVHGHLRDLLLQ